MTAAVDYSFDLGRETEGGAIFACGFTDDAGGRATSFATRVNEGGSTGSGANFAGEGEMILSEGIDRAYMFRCTIADPADLANPLAEDTIAVRQQYEVIDAIRIVEVDPPTSQPLEPGGLQTFTATVEYSRDVYRLGGFIHLAAADFEANELLPRNDRNLNSSAEQALGDGPNTVRLQVTLADVPIPEDGRLQLLAEHVNGNQFGAFEPAAFQSYALSEPIVYGGEPGVDLSIWHIEVTQVVQDDDNLIPPGRGPGGQSPRFCTVAGSPRGRRRPDRHVDPSAGRDGGGPAASDRKSGRGRAGDEPLRAAEDQPV